MSSSVLITKESGWQYFGNEESYQRSACVKTIGFLRASSMQTFHWNLELPAHPVCQIFPRSGQQFYKEMKMIHGGRNQRSWTKTKEHLHPGMTKNEYDQIWGKRATMREPTTVFLFCHIALDDQRGCSFTSGNWRLIEQWRKDIVMVLCRENKIFLLH